MTQHRPSERRPAAAEDSRTTSNWLRITPQRS